MHTYYISQHICIFVRYSMGKGINPFSNHERCEECPRRMMKYTYSIVNSKGTSKQLMMLGTEIRVCEKKKIGCRYLHKYFNENFDLTVQTTIILGKPNNFFINKNKKITALSPSTPAKASPCTISFFIGSQKMRKTGQN